MIPGRVRSTSSWTLSPRWHKAYGESLCLGWLSANSKRRCVIMYRWWQKPYHISQGMVEIGFGERTIMACVYFIPNLEQPTVNQLSKKYIYIHKCQKKAIINDNTPPVSVLLWCLLGSWPKIITSYWDVTITKVIVRFIDCLAYYLDEFLASNTIIIWRAQHFVCMLVTKQLHQYLDICTT